MDPSALRGEGDAGERGFTKQSKIGTAEAFNRVGSQHELHEFAFDDISGRVQITILISCMNNLDFHHHSEVVYVLVILIDPVTRKSSE